MLNFNTNTTQYTTDTRTRITNFTNFTSKKQLIASNFLNSIQLAYITNICNLFTTAVHNNKKYACCTLYYSNTKSYKYIVVNLNDGSIAEVGSIAEAKKEVEMLMAECDTEEVTEA